MFTQNNAFLVALVEIQHTGARFASRWLVLLAGDEWRSLICSCTAAAAFDTVCSSRINVKWPQGLSECDDCKNHVVPNKQLYVIYSIFLLHLSWRVSLRFCLIQSLKAVGSRCVNVVFSICLSICGWKCYNTRSIHGVNGVRPYSKNLFHTLLIAFMAYKLLVKFISLTQDWEKIVFIFIFYLNILNTGLLQLSPGFCFHRAGPQCVENKWSRPSVKRGWDTRSSRHCKERRGGGTFSPAFTGGPPFNNKAQLHV